MTLKQKLSVIAAAFLPILAMCVYLLVLPSRANASSCPGGTFQSGCSGGPRGWCGTGSGGCVAPHSSGIFVFCPNHPGPGICEGNSTVCCTQ